MNPRFQITDVAIKHLYDLLITRSFDDPSEFEKWQNTWNNVAEILGIERIENNGHGRIIWKDAVAHG